MKKVFLILSLVPILVFCSCSKNDTPSPQNDEIITETTADSLAIALHEIDSMLNCGTLIHSDIYAIGKLKSVEIFVHKLSVADIKYTYINFRKDCGGEYYYSWENAILLSDECKYLLSAIDTIIQNSNREVDHEEMYTYTTKDDITLASKSENKGTKWTIKLSVDKNKSNSYITLDRNELNTLKELIKESLNKIAEIE